MHRYEYVYRPLSKSYLDQGKLTSGPLLVQIWSRHPPQSIGVWKGKVMFSFPGTKISSIVAPYRGISLIRNTCLLGPYSRTIPRVLWWS